MMMIVRGSRRRGVHGLVVTLARYLSAPKTSPHHGVNVDAIVR